MKNINIYELNKICDERGWFLKVINGTETYHEELIGDIYFVCGKGGGVRGNHYHVKTDEWFCVISGSCILYLVDVVTEEKIVLELDDVYPKMIHVPNGIAHAFVNSNEDEFTVVAFTNRIFDKADTVPYAVV
ncbi:cupin domain-containing protein [Aeromonas jandaei]|uniref:polysaccharide biosynthesis C-terminal domain-containing protein n=1 Tax=Aeromonas jandaei TaxID=650 RepID=UPI000F54A28A|nr:WxcM-like domain-containing protein [Aeromonas jandaei]RQM71071.1 cupin domain-containing protein [Aeromonas jandaei]